MELPHNARLDTGDTTGKKLKVSAIDGKSKASSKQGLKGEPSNSSEEFPNGFFYCHQCAKKRDACEGLQCTFKNTASGPDLRCKAKYCKPCLRNRYGEDMEAVLQRGSNVKAKENDGHVREGYVFKCPRCNDNCNCRTCRKAKGLPPTGNLTLVAKRAGVESVATMLVDNANSTGILPGKGKQIADLPKRPRVPKVKKKPPVPATKGKAAPAAVLATERKTKRLPARKSKPLPLLRWESLPVPSTFTIDHALPRLEIYEFCLRFASLLGMSRQHLDELEEISGRRNFDEDGDEEDVSVEMGWVTETCARSILTGLLGLIEDGDVFTSTEAKSGVLAVKTTIKDIKASGANLTRMWGALVSMRSSLEALSSDPLPFPDPLPPPANAMAHTTRSGTLHGGGIYVATSAQLVPVITALVNAALGSSQVRQTLDDGVKAVKDLAKEERDRTKEEKDRWEATRKSKSTIGNVDREKHKHTLDALQRAFAVSVQAHAPRFTALGTDHEGRIYYAASPILAEQEAAIALLNGDAKKGGKAKGRAIISSDERSAMRRWGWFVAVWGEKPELSAESKGKQKAAPNSDEESDEEDGPRWWGFWQPEEIHKVAEWIAIKNGISDEITEEEDATKGAARTTVSEDEDSDTDGGYIRGPATRKELKVLVQCLRKYADVLEWRVWRMQEDNEVEKEKDTKAKGDGDRAVKPRKFYGH
ncbi:hypothetical protein OF83DRAFT_1081399 [Amylostereum chailletii]|nr:hypothetical protein OF83DRAFT_1081399 [Amylostereum chailletii]